MHLGLASIAAAWLNSRTALHPLSVVPFKIGARRMDRRRNLACDDFPDSIAERDPASGRGGMDGERDSVLAVFLAIRSHVSRENFITLVHTRCNNRHICSLR